MRIHFCSLFAAALAATFAGSAPAEDRFLADGKVLLDARVRLETVDDGAIARDAEALTLRTRLGWRSGSVNGFFVLLEAEDVRALVEDYHSTANGRTQYPVVVDPKGSEWNQAHIGWDSGSGTQMLAGRQRLLLDNQRYIGNVGWRQNEQTFDAFSLTHKVSAHLNLRYAWLDRVHRIFGNAHPNRLQAEQRLDAHLLNAAWTLGPGTLTGYGYWVANRDLPASSTQSLGLRFSGKHVLDEEREWFYSAEWADQRGWRRAPGNGSVGYSALESGLRQRGHGVRLGFELLGSNGTRAFQTPLATGHAFNGWADRFLVTPVNGLQDRYLKIDGPLGPLRYLAAWHEFRPERGRGDYGNELDLQLSWPFAEGWSAIAKYANYRSDGFGSDLRKVWLSLEYRY